MPKNGGAVIITLNYMPNLNIICKASLYSILFLLLSCESKEESKMLASRIVQIEVAQALKSSKPIDASVLGIKAFEYISLETNENTFKLANPYRVSTIGNDLLFVKYFKQMALFDQKTGKYISHIGKYGDDPESFQIVSNSVNDRQDQRFVSAASMGSKEILEYSIDTKKVVTRINIMNVLLRNDTTLSPNFSRIYDVFFEDKDNIWGFLPNLYGDTPYRLIKFNEDGVIKKAYRQGQTIKERPRYDHVIIGEAMFYEYNGSVMFKENHSDTLFEVNETRMNPRYVFNLADKSPPYEYKNEHRFPDKASYIRSQYPLPYIDRTQFVFIESLTEHDDFLIFSIMYEEELSYGFFNKTKGTTQISAIQDINSNGFYNDIDNFIPFQPNYIDRENNRLVGFVTAVDVLNWFDKNPELASRLPEELSMLSQLKPEDNPVVMIGKLKSR
jgi:hypothetical protein